MLGSLAGALLNALTSRRGYSIEAGVAYAGGPRLVLDIYTPDGAGAETPVVVWFHGGAWDSGSRAMYLFLAQALASGGVIAVLPDYRLYPEVTFPGFVEDAARAVGWTAHTVAKGRPLFVGGHSAGAHIAALVALDPRYLAAVGMDRDAVAGFIGLSGPYDFLPLTEDRYKAVFPEPMRAESQPIAFVDANAPPTLLLTGDGDRTVRPGNTTRLAAALRQHGRSVREIVYPGIGHLGTVAALASVLPGTKPPVRADMLAFIREVAGKRPQFVIPAKACTQ
ncbi:alpha/beta hydrolase [soil metagenome]